MATFKFKGGVAFSLSLAAALAAFSLVAVTHLLFGQFKPALVLPVGILMSVQAGYFAWRMTIQSKPEITSEANYLDVIVMLGIVAWTLFNLLFSSQHLFTNRDPAVYNLAGTWLGSHQNIQIKKPVAESQLNVPRITSESLGYFSSPTDNTKLHSQGAHLLPALQATLSKVLGLSVWRVNVLFGATALLAFYGFSRLIVKPRWAALGVLIMSLSLPMLFASRDAYSEPLTMTFIFGGLGLLLIAQKSKQAWQWWLAGLVLGSASLARIDAYLMFIGIELAAICLLMIARKKERAALIKCVAWLAGGMAISGYIAWLDVYTLSTAYYEAHQKFILPELALIGGLALVGALAIALNWRFNFLKRLDTATDKWRDKAIYIVVGGFFVLLSSRPVWYVGYQQIEAGINSRSFSEQTLNWIIWYFGPVLLIAGIAGYSILITRILRAKDRHILPFVAAFSVMALLYLIKPTITGDQVWATRRLLPLVIPGFVLFAMWMFERLFEKKTLSLRGHTFNLEIITTVLVTISVMSPLFITYPFLLRKEHAGELSQVQAVCNSASKNAVIVWAGESSAFAVQPTRAICSNDSLGLGIKPDLDQNKQLMSGLANKAQANNREVIIGFYGDDANRLPLTTDRTSYLISAITYNEIEHTYKRAPRNMTNISREVYLGKLDHNGVIIPLGTAN